MSTRATYRFENRLRANCASYPALTLYIHHDGYPSGAAAYFWEAHHFANQKGGFVMAFIRANENAEVTESHQQHGDTEFRYTLTDGVLTAEKAFYDSTDTKKWRVIFEGNYWEFINQNPESIDGFTPIRIVPSLWGNGAFSRQQCEANAKRARDHATEYRAKFPHFTGNADSADKDAERLEQVLADYDAMNAFDEHKPSQVAQ